MRALVENVLCALMGVAIAAAVAYCAIDAVDSRSPLPTTTRGG